VIELNDLTAIYETALDSRILGPLVQTIQAVNFEAID
jgi:hypothetical protein